MSKWLRLFLDSAQTLRSDARSAAARSIAVLSVMALAGIVASCKPTVPDTFIPESEMENLLYDYHLAAAMARQSEGDKDANAIAYRAAVLKKYGVSEELLDTSMVYYMRHTERLQKIYERISDRMDREAQELGATIAMNGMTVISANGDTADVWNGQKALALIPRQPYNLYQFNQKADSSFHKGDKLILTFRTNFIFQDGSRDGMAYLAVIFANDSVATRNMHVSSASNYNLQLDDGDSLGIKEVKGFFLLGKGNQSGGSTTTLRLMSVTDIHLFRCHAKPKTDGKQPADESAKTRDVNATKGPDTTRLRPRVAVDSARLPQKPASMPRGKDLKIAPDSSKRKFK